jgi:hypothetical protein
VIDRQQLAAALERLDPREREVLDLSLRRRVPDDALARVYGLEAAEVARRRTSAIERLSEDLDIQRGADLGHMLQALLEPETWTDVVISEPEPVGEVVEEPTGTEPIETDPEVELAEDAAISGPAEQMLEAEKAAQPEPEPERGEADHVLEMLGERSGAERAEGRKRRRLTAALAAAATVLLPAAGIVAASTLGDESDGGGGGGSGSQTRNFVPEEEGPLAQPFASEPEPTSGYAVARVRRTTPLHSAPGGTVKLRIPRRTEWGSARVMGVVRQRGEWLAVQPPELDNGDVAWLRTADAELSTVPWSLHVKISRRELIVRKDGRFVRRMPIAVGSPSHPTPEGRFSVTDKLKVADSGSPYGCCVLALSAHQSKLPPGWPGGDRVAVHATSDLTSIGRPVSLGCMRTQSDQARWLINTIPLGAPIFIRA